MSVDCVAANRAIIAIVRKCKPNRAIGAVLNCPPISRDKNCNRDKPIRGSEWVMVVLLLSVLLPQKVLRL